MVEFDSEIITRDLPAKLILYLIVLFIFWFLTPLLKMSVTLKIIASIIMLPIVWIICEAVAER